MWWTRPRHRQPRRRPSTSTNSPCPRHHLRHRHHRHTSTRSFPRRSCRRFLRQNLPTPPRLHTHTLALLVKTYPLPALLSQYPLQRRLIHHLRTVRLGFIIVLYTGKCHHTLKQFSIRDMEKPFETRGTKALQGCEIHRWGGFSGFRRGNRDILRFGAIRRGQVARERFVIVVCVGAFGGWGVGTF